MLKETSMRDAAKFFGAMVAWALFCNVLMGILPRNPPVYIILPFAAFTVLGLIWAPALVTWGLKDANGIVRMTFYMWLGFGAVAFLAVLALGL